jgi:hypothetical protein
MLFIKHKIIVPIRGVIYKLGGRPKYGSIWHSPSLHLHYLLRELKIGESFAEGLRRNKKD